VYAVNTLQPDEDVKAPREGERRRLRTAQEGDPGGASPAGQCPMTNVNENVECVRTVKRLRSRPRPMPQATLIKRERERRTRRSRRSLVRSRVRVPLRTTVTQYVFGEASGREHNHERTDARPRPTWRVPNCHATVTPTPTATLLAHTLSPSGTQRDRKRHVA
jgi:hypothetical protein